MSSPSLEDLRLQIGMLGARPFHQEIVQSPWNPVIDVEGLHKDTKKHIRNLLATCGQTSAARCLTIHANAGYGKTHLLSWTRQEMENGSDGFFVYVPPYHPESGLLEQHIVRAVYDSLRHRSHKQRERFEQSVQTFLVRQYDECVRQRHRLRQLRAGNFWRRLLRPSTLKIGSRGHEEQLAALQRAFEHSTFLRFAFDNLIREVQEKNPPSSSLQLDWDVFSATCMLACGNAAQRWYADTWIRNDDNIPPTVFDTAHLRHRCEGSAKMLNALFTLQRVTGQSLCLAFDQFESVYHHYESMSRQGGEFGESLSVVVDPLNSTVGFCFVFLFQTSIWVNFVENKTTSNRMLTDRMTADRGPQELLPLNDAAAVDLIQQRMKAFVWRELKDRSPPDDQPLYPFEEEDVKKIRKDSHGELREFLRIAQQRYEKLLNSIAPPPRIELERIEPPEALSSDATPIVIHGQHLPSIVEVRFGRRAPLQINSQPNKGVIEVVTPTGLVGEYPVEVRSPDDVTNFAALPFRFIIDVVRRPYRVHTEGGKFREQRERLGMTQKQVAEKVGTSQAQMSNLEREVWRGAPDDVYVKLAELYQKPLSDFQK